MERTRQFSRLVNGIAIVVPGKYTADQQGS
jgi:hypothetical protein